MSNLADQAEGLRHIFGHRLARVIAVCAENECRAVPDRLAAALIEQGRRVAVLTDLVGARGQIFSSPCHVIEDLASADDQVDVAEHPVERQTCFANLAKRSRVSARVQARLFARLAAIQQANDVIIIAANGLLRDTFAHVSELIVVATAHEDGIISAYRTIKDFHATCRSANYRVYTIVNGAAGEQARRVTHNLNVTANRFLSLQVRHLGSPDSSDDAAAYREIAEALLAPMLASADEVAIGACIANLFDPKSVVGVPNSALLIQ